MSTYSIFTASSYESTRFDNIVDVLNGLPDNSSNLITPRTVRNAVLSAYDNSIFRETTVSTYLGTYLGIDNKLLRLPILLGKKTISGTETLDNALLSSDTDIFIYNSKSDANPSLQDTKVSFLAGNVFNDFDYAPYIKATKISSPSRIDLSIINPSSSGIINIGTTSSRLFLSGYEYPGLISAPTGSVLQFTGTGLGWNKVISGTVGYLPYYNTPTTQSESALFQTSNTLRINSGYKITDSTSNLQITYTSGITMSLSYGNPTTKKLDIGINGIYMNHNEFTFQSNAINGSLLDISTTTTNIYSKDSVSLYSDIVLVSAYDTLSSQVGYQLILQTQSGELLSPSGQGFVANNSYVQIEHNLEVKVYTPTINLPVYGIGNPLYIRSILPNNDPSDDQQAALLLTCGVNKSYTIRLDVPYNGISDPSWDTKIGLTPNFNFWFPTNSGVITAHQTKQYYGNYGTVSGINSYQYLASDINGVQTFKNAVYRNKYVQTLNTSTFFNVNHNLGEQYVTVTCYIVTDTTYSGITLSSESVVTNVLITPTNIELVDGRSLKVYLPTTHGYIIIVNA